MKKPANYRRLEGSERRPAPGATLLGPADPNETFSVTISVRRRPDAPPVHDVDYWTKTPPGQRKFLSHEEFAAKYGADQADLDAVAAFARAHGLKVAGTSISGRSVTLSGTAGQMSKAFAADLGRYETPTMKYRGRDGYIHVPADMADLVMGVFGLDNRPVGGHDSCDPTNTTPLYPTGSGGVADLYNFPGGNGANQIIGVFEGPGGYVKKDIDSFLGTTSYLPPKDVPVGASNPGNNPGIDQGSDTEILLDICLALSIAPGAQIAVYFAEPDPTNPRNLTSQSYMATIGEMINPTNPTDPKLSVISISWHLAEGDDAQTLAFLGITTNLIDTIHSYFQDAAMKGITVFASSGDRGSNSGVPTLQQGPKVHVQYPGSDPLVTACGGTTICSVMGKTFNEVTWNDTDNKNNDHAALATGGGISYYYPLPPYQNGIGVPLSANNDGRKGRGVPDVAGNASGNSGYLMSLSSYTPTFYFYARGTSAVAPLYAGLMALINANLGQNVGFLNPTLYALGEISGVFRDITEGNNLWPDGPSTAPYYSAGPSWDACTGWGSINGGALQGVLLQLYQKGCFFITERSTYGKEEVDALLKLSPGKADINPSFFVAVDGFRPSDFPSGGINTLTPTSAQLSAWAPAVTASKALSGVTIKPVAVDSDDPFLLPEVQRFTFTYEVEFSDDSEFASISPGVPEVVGLTASFLSVSANALIYFILEQDPFFQNIDPSNLNQPSWLSVDLRVFKVNESESKFGALGISAATADTDAPRFIRDVINNLRAGNAGSDTFEGLPTNEEVSALEFLQTKNGKAVFNFALAKVHYRDLANDAKNARVFFRLFQAQTTSGAFNTSTEYRRWPTNLSNQPIPLLGIESGEYVTVPCFADQRVDSTAVSMTEQTDDTNVQTIKADPSGAEVVMYYGCWLDINQPLKPNGLPNTPFLQTPPSTKVDGPFTGTSTNPLLSLAEVITRNSHQCLVAEIAFDPVQIPAGATPSETDKLAQRNLAFIDGPNPGVTVSRRIPVTFDIRPSLLTTRPDRTLDELMIDWGDTPVGSTAQIYLPAVRIAQVLATAARMYPANHLTRFDDHTLQCQAGGITYIPVLPGEGANYAGLITVDLPDTVKKGQAFNIVVRQVTNVLGSPDPKISLRGKIDVMVPLVEWRRVLSAFQMAIAVKTKEVMLQPEEELLSYLLWIQQAISPKSRWYPVFQRYVDQVAERVRGLGGDPSLICPSPNGDCRKKGHPKKEHEARISFTGKIDGICHDRFGDFEGFLLDADGGKHRFESHERKVKELVHRAWSERTLVTVIVEKDELHIPVSIILRGMPQEVY